MPLFKYQAFAKNGRKVSGTVYAATLAAAKEQVQLKQLMPINLAPIQEESSSFILQLFVRPIEPKTVVLFTRQLSVLLKSAIPLLQALELLTEQFEGRFKTVLVNIKDGLKGGDSFANQLQRYPSIFPNVYVQLVRAGEATGKLDTILARLTTYLERSEETKKTMRKAMVQPTIMLSFAGMVVVFLLVVLVPKLSSMFGSLGKELPLPTVILISISDFVLANGKLLLVGLATTALAFAAYRRTPQGRYRIDALLLKLPLVGFISRTKAVVQFCSTLGMLLESGVNLAQALDIVCNIIENSVLTKNILAARDKIIKEGKIARYLRESGMFPPIASYMISTGEQSGKLAQMLLTVGNDYDQELVSLTGTLLATMSSGITVVMGLIVLFIVLAIFLPILSLSDLGSF